MGKILLYSSGKIVTDKPTGGDRRFLELAKYLVDKPYAELCCADDEDMLQAVSLKADLHLIRPPQRRSLLPQELRILLANRVLIKQMVETQDNGSAMIIFDVPPAVGPILLGAKNVVLMLRKDLIGYEQLKNKKKSITGKFSLSYQWLCESLCLNRAKLIICQCAYDREKVLNRHPLIREKINQKLLIQINNVNPSWIIDHSEQALPEQRNNAFFRVCFVGGFDTSRKGQDLFLQAAKFLSERHEDLEFILVGGGEKLPDYQKKWSSDRIVFYGRMDNPISVMKTCDLMVVPSLADSCPNTVMESLYNGIPVIGSRAGGIPEILLDDDALFEPSWKDVAERIEQYYQNSEDRHRLGERQAYRKRELEFNWAERIINLIFREEKTGMKT